MFVINDALYSIRSNFVNITIFYLPLKMKKFIRHIISHLLLPAGLCLSTNHTLAFEPGIPFKINHVLQVNEKIHNDFKISPDAKRVVYRVANSGLFSVPVLGGAVTNLTTSIPDQEGRVVDFKITPDSSKVIYILDTPDGHNLRAVDINGGFSRSISLVRENSNDQKIVRYLMSPDSSSVVYLVDEDRLGRNRLYRSTLKEPFSVGLRIGPELTSNQSIEPDIRFIPNQNTVVYRANLNNSNRIDLYRTAITTFSRPVQLNASMVRGGNVQLPPGALADSSAFSISNDGKYVVYHADQRINGSYELYSATLTFPIRRNTLNPLSIDAAVDVFDHRISPDSKRVLYRANERFSHVKGRLINELFSVSISGSRNPTRISDDQSINDAVFKYKFGPNSARVAYSGDPDNTGEIKLYSVLVNGGPITTLTANIVNGGGVTSFDFSRFGAKVVYSARQDLISVNELFSIRPDGRDLIKLHRSLVPGENVLMSGIAIDEINDRVLYRSDQSSVNVFEIFSSSIDDDSQVENVKLNLSFQNTRCFLLSSDKRYLVYLANQIGGRQFELYAVDLTGVDDA